MATTKKTATTSTTNKEVKEVEVTEEKEKFCKNKPTDSKKFSLIIISRFFGLSFIR